MIQNLSENKKQYYKRNDDRINICPIFTTMKIQKFGSINLIKSRGFFWLKIEAICLVKVIDMTVVVLYLKKSGIISNTYFWWKVLLLLKVNISKILHKENKF